MKTQMLTPTLLLFISDLVWKKGLSHSFPEKLVMYQLSFEASNNNFGTYFLFLHSKTTVTSITQSQESCKKIIHLERIAYSGI